MSADAAAHPSVASALRGPATWYSWLLTGFYIYAVNVQGNVVPFLQAEFALSYRAVSLHSSAIAAGIILVGLFGDRVARRLGRRKTLWLGVGGLAGGSILLCLAPAPWASIASCFLIGILGALVPAIIPALLADIHGPRRAAPRPMPARRSAPMCSASRRRSSPGSSSGGGSAGARRCCSAPA